MICRDLRSKRPAPVSATPCGATAPQISHRALFFSRFEQYLLNVRHHRSVSGRETLSAVWRRWSRSAQHTGVELFYPQSQRQQFVAAVILKFTCVQQIRDGQLNVELEAGLQKNALVLILVLLVGLRADRLVREEDQRYAQTLSLCTQSEMSAVDTFNCLELVRPEDHGSGIDYYAVTDHLPAVACILLIAGKFLEHDPML